MRLVCFAVVVYAGVAFGDGLSVDFSKGIGKIRRELHASSFGGQLVGISMDAVRDMVVPLGLSAARTHDWALVNPGQRICDTHFLFPLPGKDPADPSNYYFAPTDEIIDMTIQQLGMNVFYRLGTSIESVNARRKGDANPRYYNSVEPEDWTNHVAVLEHIISHYTEGWNRGFFHRDRMRYWELWNEPNDRPGGSWIVRDQNPDRETNYRRFFDFYAFTLNHLKKRFPQLKFGGPAMCYLDEPFLRGLLARCKEVGYAPDFISWHHYWYEPELILSQPAKARAICDEYGFTCTELIINEWHYIPYEEVWDDFGKGPETFAKIIHPTTGLGGIDSAVFALQVLTGLQTTCLDQAYYYGIKYDKGSNWGFVKADGSLGKTYYGLKMFARAIDKCGMIVASSSHNGVRVFGTRSVSGNKLALIVSAFKGGPSEVEVRIAGLPDGARISTFVLDDAHDLQEVQTRFENDVIHFDKADDRSAAWYVEVTR